MADVKNNATLPTDLLAYWEFEEESGTRVDALSNWDLAQSGGVGFDTGIIGNAAEFVSANSEWLGTATDFTYDADFISIALWMKTSTDHGFTIVMGVNDGIAATFMFFKTGSTYQFLVTNVSDSGVISPTIAEGTLEDGDWHNVIGTYDGSDVRIYLDGSEVGTGTSQTGNIDTNQPDKFSIGAGAGSGTPGSFFNGLIDQAGVWNKALSTQEVTDLWNSGAGLPYEEAAAAFIPSITMI